MKKLWASTAVTGVGSGRGMAAQSRADGCHHQGRRGFRHPESPVPPAWQQPLGPVLSQSRQMDEVSSELTPCPA